MGVVGVGVWFSSPFSGLVGGVGVWGLGLRHPERLAFFLHRLTGLVLFVYFVFHAVSMADAFGGFGCCGGVAFSLVNSWAVRWVVAVSAWFHGVNGLRLILVEVFGLGVGRPGVPRPPYVSGSLRSWQRLLAHIVFLGLAFVAGLTAYWGLAGYG